MQIRNLDDNGCCQCDEVKVNSHLKVYIIDGFWRIQLGATNNKGEESSLL